MGVRLRSSTAEVAAAIGCEAAEIILCGGAFNSPQLLQLSGIGDPAHLEGLGIDVVAPLAGVGENLQDHLEVYLQHACTQPVSMQPYLAHWRKPIIGLQWLLRRGPAATNHFEAGAFVRSNDRVDYPNLMFHFLPIAIRYDGSTPAGGHGYQVHVGPMYSDVRGTVKITSTDPRQHPAVQFNYLSTEADRREWVETIRTARRILGQPAFAPFDGGEISPGPSVETDDEILDWVARDAETALHPSCTARMGTDDLSVVHPDSLRVHGVDGPAGRRRVGHAEREQREHLRPGDDDRRDGCRSDPRQRTASGRSHRGVPGARRSRGEGPPVRPRWSGHEVPSTSWLLVVLAVAIGVVLACCGGGSSDDAAPTAPPDVEADAPVADVGRRHRHPT